MTRFSASFETTATPDGTRAVRTLTFDLLPPFKWLAEPLLRKRLRREVEEELERARQYLEG